MAHTYNGGFQVNEDGAWHVFAGSGFTEKSVERVVAAADCLVRRHLPIGLDAVLKAVQLPAGVADLDAGLADVDGNAFPLKGTPSMKKHIPRSLINTINNA